MKVKLLLATLAFAMVGASPASAHEQLYSTTLSGPNEFPANASPGTGTALVTVDFDLGTMRVETSFSGLLAPVTASHIHCCVLPTATMPTAGVATPVPSFPGFPSGVTSGTYDQTFALGLASSYNPAFVTSNGGTVSGAMSALLAGLDAGMAYLNIHTSSPAGTPQLGFPGGEIRGFLQPVPEPETYVLMLAGLAMVGWMTARRRKQ